MNKIIIVGNGGSVLTKELGSYIDNNFNTVVRINQHKIDGYEKYIGTRTDVLCLNLPCYEKLLLPSGEIYSQELNDLLLNKPDIDSASLAIMLQNTVCPKPDLNTINRVILFTNSTPNKLINHIEIYPNKNNNSTGFRAIQHFLGEDLTITGFDFFQKTSHYWHAFNSIITQNKMIKDCTKKFTDGHPYEQEQYIIQKWIITKKIKQLEYER